MPITLLDIILLLVMLVSGLLAMIRGFMREILSIGAWGIAAADAATPGDRPLAQQTGKSPRESLRRNSGRVASSARIASTS